MKRIVFLTLVAAVVASAAAPGLGAAETGDAARPRVEAVFVLDTTGSMGGLIDAAKQKIWAIANTMATAKPAPDIRMGLVGYRDRGDAYVTTRTPLTTDLDAVYRDLMAYQANGGGDTPESVNQALHEAVTRMDWSKDPRTYRVIFLVGDCPPHMDYANDVKYPQTCETAARAGIVINTIQCGTQDATTPVWRDVALRAEGRFFQVEQSGSAILASTPFDGKLADLSRRLDETRIYYGEAEEVGRNRARQEVADAIYAAAPAAALATRAEFNAGASGAANLAPGKELLTDVAAGKVKAAELKTDVLPEALQKMPAKDRDAFVKQRLAEREKIQAEIRQLAGQRQKHLEEQAKRQVAGKPSLDQGIFDCIRKQGAERGLTYEGGPAL